MRRKFRKSQIALGAVIVLALCSCSHAPKNLHDVSEIEMQSLRVRRPSGPGADPRVGPGGVDYRARPLPDEKLDCERLDPLYAKLAESAQVRECLRSLSQVEGQLKYRLKREAVPTLELLPEKNTPACVKEHLSELPVPREIVFRTREQKCFSSRIAIEADEALGFKVPINRWEMRIPLPIEPIPLDGAGVSRLLGSWSLSPFWDSERGAIPSLLLPEHLCRICIVETPAEKEVPPKMRTYWP